MRGFKWLVDSCYYVFVIIWMIRTLSSRGLLPVTPKKLFAAFPRTGIGENLKASQAYPPKFGKVVAVHHLQHMKDEAIPIAL